MQNNYNRPQDFIATVYQNGKCSKRRVKCLITFSDNPNQYPKIAIRLKDKATTFQLSSSFSIDIVAREYDVKDDLISEVKTVGGYYVNPDDRFYKNLTDDHIIEIGYSKLIHCIYLRSPLENNYVKFSLFNLNFSLSFGTMIQDEKGIRHDFKSYFGDFKIIDDAVLSFKSETHYSEIQEDTLRRFRKDVLVIKYDKNKTNLKKLEAFVKSLLPYLSFLSRSNVSYNHVFHSIEGNNIISNRYIVLSFDRIQGSKGYFDYDYAIDRKYHKQFIEESISRIMSANKLALDSIYQFNNAISQPISSNSFVLLYMALESLINAYISTVNRGYTYYLVRIYPRNMTMRKRTYFKKVIKPQKRKFMNKYNYIIRLSNINNSDLWPLYDQGSHMNLSEIRNKIVHEGQIRDRKNLWYAFCHLELIFLRIFFFVVDWRGDNNINPTALATHIPYREWQNMLIYK